MPLPKDMGQCMSKVKDEYPKGRSDDKKSKKEAHKQHVAMCMRAAGKSKKQNNEGQKYMSFKDFLVETS